MEIDKNKLMEDMRNLNFPRTKAEQKQKAREYISNELKECCELKSIERMIKKWGTKVKCVNLENTNDGYDVVLIAHYDTHVRGLSYINSYISRNIQMIQNRFIKGIMGIAALGLYLTVTIYIPFLLQKVYPLKILPMDSFPFPFLEGVSLIYYLGILYIAFRLLYPKMKESYVADDNTSGVVGLIHLVKHLHSMGHMNRIKVIFTDNEERGLLGVKCFEKENSDVLVKKRFVNFDCIGRGSNILITAKNKELVAEVQKYLEELNTNTVYFPVSCSDDKVLSEKGYNAIGFIRADLNHKGIKQIPWTHTKQDTIENISPERIVETIKAAACYIEGYLSNETINHEA